MTDLGKFDGKDVIRTTIAVTNAGDGLSSAMKVDPQLFHLGEQVYVVLECEVANVKFKPLSDDDSLLDRIHTLRAGAATIVDKDLVAAHLEAQAARIQKLKDEEAGYERTLLEEAERDQEEREAAEDRPQTGEEIDSAIADAVAAGDARQAEGDGLPGEPADDDFVTDAEGFAEPTGNVTPIKGAAKKPVKRAAAKKAPAKRPARKK